MLPRAGPVRKPLQRTFPFSNVCSIGGEKPQVICRGAIANPEAGLRYNGLHPGCSKSPDARRSAGGRARRTGGTSQRAPRQTGYPADSWVTADGPFSAACRFSLPFDGWEDLLAEAEGLGGHLQELVDLQKLQGLLQAHRARR